MQTLVDFISSNIFRQVAPGNRLKVQFLHLKLIFNGNIVCPETAYPTGRLDLGESYLTIISYPCDVFVMLHFISPFKPRINICPINTSKHRL